MWTYIVFDMVGWKHMNTYQTIWNKFCCCHGWLVNRWKHMTHIKHMLCFFVMVGWNRCKHMTPCVVFDLGGCNIWKHVKTHVVFDMVGWKQTKTVHNIWNICFCWHGLLVNRWTHRNTWHNTHKHTCIHKHKKTHNKCTHNQLN